MSREFTGVVGDHLMIAHYVRYDRLTELINTEFNGSNYEEINLCIDAYSMINSVYGLKPNQFVDRYSIASAIINACAHYRNFFWTRYKVTCKIWVVYSDMYLSLMEGRSFVPTYGNMYTKEPNNDMNILLDANANILNSLCPYIPDVTFIYSRYEPGLVFGRVALHCDGKIPTIIVSKDPWNLQVVGNLPNVYMLRPVKREGNDLSVLIGANNLMDYYAKLRKCDADVSKLSPSTISFIMAATRFPERNIKATHSLTSIIKYLNNAIDQKYISIDKSIYDIQGLCNDLNAVNKSKLNGFEIDLRMKAIGFNPCMYRYMASPAVDNIDIINLHDPDSVKLINEKYFSKVPLDLMSL